MQHMADYLANNGDLLTPPLNIAQLTSLIPQGVGFTLSDERFSLQRRWVDTLEAIAVFDPDLVFFVGFNSPLTTPLIAARPVLGLCVHALAPMAAVDVWLTADPAQAGKSSRVWGDAIPAAWGYHHPYRVALAPMTKPVTRAELDLPDDVVVCVSVGARLVDEVNGIWAQRMLALLKRNPHAIWLLVGGAGHLPPALANAVPAQLRVYPHQADLRSLLRCTDIYVNPQRTGGGFSVAEAMAEGIAVVALAGSDGGDKVGDAASPDLDVFFGNLQSFMDNPALRRTQGQALQARFVNQLDLSQSGPSLLTACQLAVARHQSIV